MKLSVIIESESPDAPKNLDALLQQEIDFDTIEILVSTHAAPPPENGDSSQCKIIYFPPFISRGERLHDLILKAQGDVLLFLNEEDIPVSQKFLAAHQSFHSEPTGYILQGKTSGVLVEQLFLSDYLQVKNGFEKLSYSNLSVRRESYLSHGEALSPALHYLLFLLWGRGAPGLTVQSTADPKLEIQTDHEISPEEVSKELLAYFQINPGVSSEIFGFDVGTDGRLDQLREGVEQGSIQTLRGDRGPLFQNFVKSYTSSSFERSKLCYLDCVSRFSNMDTNTDRQEEFVFILPTYNMEGSIERALQSVASQTYSRWRIILTDDCSNDETIAVAKRACERLGINEKVEISQNETRLHALHNCINAIRSCKAHEIICRLDGDDWLCDMDALALIQKAYDDCDPLVLWTKNRFGFSNHNRSGPLKNGIDPYQQAWVSSHLRTFRKELLDSVNDANFKDGDGNYFKRTEDQAVMLPLLHLSDRNMFLPVVTYHYSCERDEVSDDTARATQADIATFIRERGYVS